MRPFLVSQRSFPSMLSVAVREALQPAVPPRFGQGGVALFEVLLTGVASVAVLAGGYMLYQKAETAEQVAREADDVGFIAHSVVRVYSSRGGYQGMSNDDAMAGRVFPSQMVSPDGTVHNAWGGAVTVSDTPVSINGATASSNNGFTIAYTNVGSAACANFAANAGPGFYDVRVAGTSVLDATTHAINLPTLTRLCAAAPSSEVDFIFGATTNPLGPNSCSASLPPGQTRTQTFACASGELISNAGPNQYLASAPQTSQRNPYCSGSGTVSWTDWSAWSPSYACAPMCTGTSAPESAPAPCPPGEVASIAPYGPTSGTQSRVNTQSCATPIGPLGPPSNPPWTISGQSCAPVCVAPAPTSTTTPTPCPPGQVSSTAPYAPTSGTTTSGINYACTTPVGPVAATPFSTSTPSSCSPVCTPSTGSDTRTAACAPGSLISNSGPYQYQTSAPQTSAWTETCASPVGPLGSKVNGPWSPAYSCAPACTLPTPATQTQCDTSNTYSLSCPVGQSGTNSYQLQETRTASCPAPTGSYTWSAWTDAASKCNQVNTCAPTCSWGSAPTTTPACASPSWGSQIGGTWVHAPTCPNWTYSGGSCPACPPAPPDGSRTVSCVAPTVGTWTQTQTWTSAPGPTCWVANPWTPATAPAGACAPASPVYSNPETCVGVAGTVFPGGGTCASGYSVAGAPAVAFSTNPGFTVWFQVTITYGASSQTVTNTAAVNTITSASGQPHCAGAADYECSDAITGSGTVVNIGGKQFTVSAIGAASQLYDPADSINKWIGRTGAGAVTSP